MGVDVDNSGAVEDDELEITHQVKVTATDPSGASKEQLVTVTINDVNDAPKFGTNAPEALWVTEWINEDSTLTLRIRKEVVTDTANDLTGAAYVATDADELDAGGTADTPRPRVRVAATENAVEIPAVVSLEYSVEGPDGDKFKIDRSGDADTVAEADGETVTLEFDDHKPNYEKQKKYEITIVVKDDDAPQGRGTVDVTGT